MTFVLKIFDPTAMANSSMAYGQKPKVVKAKQSATANGENVPTVQHW